MGAKVKPVIELQKFSVAFGQKKVLDAVDLTINQEEFCVFMGLSGVGKTMTLRSIVGLHNSYLGKITVSDGLLPGIVFQKPNLIPWLSIKENLLISTRKPADQIDFWIKRVGLKNYENYKPHQVSGGMQQKAALIRGILFNPKFIILDEPFSSLDMPQKYQLQLLLHQVWKEEKATVVYITHDIDEAIFLSEKIFFFSKVSKGIGAEIKVNLAFPRVLPELRLHLDFITIYQKLFDLLNKDYQEEVRIEKA